MTYCTITKMDLANVTKNGNKIAIQFDTVLAPNNLKIKKNKLFFFLDDGVSEDIPTNDFFCSICRYIK